MKKILIIFAHPALQKSRINQQLINGLDKITGVTFHDLYHIYPEFDIDVAEEQALLEAHDIIIFHHPFFWYNTPAILKEWQDLVLEHNWAYGKQGNALKGKYFFNVVTTGGKKDAYHTEGYNRFTIRQLLVPIERTAVLCKMTYLPPYVLHGTHSISPEEIEMHRKNYHQLLELLRDEKLELSANIRKQDYLNNAISHPK